MATRARLSPECEKWWNVMKLGRLTGEMKIPVSSDSTIMRMEY